MLGTGGSAIVARTLGEGRRELAQRYFSMIIYAVILLGGVLTVVSVWLTEPIARLAGASDDADPGLRGIWADPSAGKRSVHAPGLLSKLFCGGGAAPAGLAYSIAAGVTNMVLDYVLIAVLDLALPGRPGLRWRATVWAACCL